REHPFRPVRGCSRQIDRSVPALQQTKRGWHLGQRKRSSVPAAGQTLVLMRTPRQVRTEQTLQFEQNSCSQVEQKSKSCAAWYSSSILDLPRNYSVPRVTRLKGQAD